MTNFKQTVKNVVAIGLLGLTLTSCYKDKFRDQVKLNNELAETNKGLKSQIVSLEDAVNDAQIEIEVNAFIIDGLDGDNTKLADQNNNLGITVIDLTTQIAAIKSQLANTDNVDDLNTDLRNKETALEAALAKIHELTEVIRLLNREVQSLQIIINELRDANTEYSLNQVLLLTTIDSLTVQIDDLVNAPAIIEYRAGTVTVSTSIIDNTDNSRIAELEALLAAATTTISDYNAPDPIDNTDYTRIAELEALLATATGTIINRDARIAELEALLLVARNELEVLNTQILDFIRRVVTEEDRINADIPGGNVFTNTYVTATDYLVEFENDYTNAYIDGDIVFDATTNMVSFSTSTGYNFDNVTVTFNNPFDAAIFMISLTPGQRFDRSTAEAQGAIVVITCATCV